MLGFTPYWDYKPTSTCHADSTGVYFIDEILDLSTINKIHLNCDCVDGGIFNGLRSPILFSFTLEKPAGYKVFHQPETIPYKKNK